MTADFQPGEGGDSDRTIEIAISYLTFGGIVAAAFLLMKFVVAMQSLGAVPPPGF